MIGEQIAGYEVRGELGRGGMGTVYEVVRPGTTDRLALKLLQETEPLLVERFVREARAQEFLGRHQNVISLVESGQHQGRQYFVMPLAAGGTLRDLVPPQADLRQAVRLLAQAARAVHFANEAGIIHRDLKPENVLVDADGQALLTDFGVAKTYQEQRLTQTGDLLGTPGYMAPEQLGDQGVDRRADVYGLGGVLYYLLAGQAPFTGGSSVSTLNRVVNEPPVPPRELMPQTPPALEEVCLRALAKSPDERQQTAEAFAREMEDALAGTPRAAAEGARVGASVWLLLLASLLGAALGTALGRGLVGESRTTAGVESQSRWAEVVLLLREGRPPDPGVLEELEGTADEEAARLLPLARAQAALLREGPDAALDLLDRLAESPERHLQEAQVRLARGEVEAAWDLLERAGGVSLPWLSGGWPAAARRLEEVGRPGLAARAYRQALAHPSLASAEEQAGWAERAWFLDAAGLLEAGKLPARALCRAAVERLRQTDGRDPVQAAAVSQARLRLIDARLLDPELQMGEACQALRRLGKAEAPAVRHAARPWQQALDEVERALVDRVLNGPALSRDARAEVVVGHGHERELAKRGGSTWPPDWNRVVFLADSCGVDYPLLAEALLWRPELSFLWFRLGLLRYGGRLDAQVGRLRSQAVSLHGSPEALYWLADHHLRAQQMDEAWKAARLCLTGNLNRMGRFGRLSPTHQMLVARIAVASREEARVRDPALELLSSLEKHKSGLVVYWLIRARACKLVGDDEAAERYLQEAERR